MNFETIHEKHVDKAIKLAEEAYNRERMLIEALGDRSIQGNIKESLEELFSKNCGIVAFEAGEMLGYMSFWGGLENQFGNVIGSFSPLHGNAVGGKNRGQLASLLFQKTSEEMIKKDILSYAICTYAHDIEVRESLVMNGFGIRCADGIRLIEKPLNHSINMEFTYEELSYKDAACLLPLKNGLVKHLRKSPVYFPCKEFSETEFVELNEKRRSRFFIAKDKEDIIGYIEITKDGETFISEDMDTVHINGAFLQEGCRGKGILQSLLVHSFEKLKQEGVKKISVDFETINPTALRFWSKYFDIYTHSYVRRLDERAWNK